MNRREYLQAAAVVLGANAVTAGSALADQEADDRYQVVTERFDDVTAFRGPDTDTGGRDYARLYDAEAETLVYATLAGSGATRRVLLATRDTSETALDG